MAYLFFPAQEGGGNFYGDMMGMLAALLLGLPLVISALKELRSGHGHMDELAALAVTAAFATGEYFESGAIAFFMILTTLVEHKTALGARRHIESLIGLTPTKAHLVDGEGEREIETKDLKPGDGREMVAKHCLACHDATLITTAQLTRSQWNRVMSEMIEEQDMEEPIPEIRQAILEYLVETQGPQP